MKAPYYIIIAILILTGILTYVFYPRYYEFKTIESPDKKYSLKIFVKKDMYFLSMHGESDFKKAYVVLLNVDGQTIYKPSLLKRGNFLLGDLSVEWLPEEGKVYYTKFDFIMLK